MFSCNWVEHLNRDGTLRAELHVYRDTKQRRRQQGEGDIILSPEETEAFAKVLAVALEELPRVQEDVRETQERWAANKK